MNLQIVLFAIRLLGAGVLLVFLGLIFWYLYQDLRVWRSLRGGPVSGFGALRIIANTSDDPPIDSVLELSPVTSIGRNNRNTIVLTDNYTSGEHALLTWRESQWWLEDLGSRNGTLLNDVAITDPTVISVGDIITIGEIRFKLEMPGTEGGRETESGIRDSNP